MLTCISLCACVRASVCASVCVCVRVDVVPHSIGRGQVLTHPVNLKIGGPIPTQTRNPTYGHTLNALRSDPKRLCFLGKEGGRKGKRISKMSILYINFHSK